MQDAQIAAITRVHDRVIITRNTGIVWVDRMIVSLQSRARPYPSRRRILAIQQMRASINEDRLVSADRLDVRIYDYIVYQLVMNSTGGEGGIRTHGTL
jgi:hypothetical protein